MGTVFAGPMPLRTFFEDLMPAGGRRWVKEILPKMPRVGFSTVPCETNREKDMYSPICKGVNKAKVCPGFKLICVANKGSMKDCQLRPDLALVGPSSLGTLDDMHCWAQVKGHKRKDAFYNFDPEESTVDTSEKGVDDRADMLSYAAALLSRQHRVFAFSLHFFGRFVRILRWDRSGCIVSEAFNYHEDPDSLAEFFWRYSHLTPEQQGFDTSAVRATKNEAALLSLALDAFIKESKPRDVSYLRPRDDSTYAAFKILIDDGNNDAREFIIRQPFWHAESLRGRATRVYAAYDLTEKRLVFLKDSWHEEGDDCEAEIYDELKQYNVPFLPDVLLSRDVKIKDQVQYTKSHEYSHPSDYPAWRLPCETMPKLVHYRLVQELVYPLASVVPSKETVQAIRDAVETIKVAHKADRSLHGDISTGNIMIGKNGRGILNDWDQAIKLLSGNAHTYRTGTWPFISVHLLRNPKKPHDVYDDLESAFWVLLSISLEYFPHHQLRGRPLSHDIFHEIRDVNDQIYSGCHKVSVLLFQLQWVTWECKPLNGLIQGLGRIFRTYVCLDLADEGQMVGDVDGGVDNIIDLFDSALSSDGWVEDDVVQEIDPKRQQLEARAIIKTVRRPSTVEYGNNSTDTKTALSTNYPRSQSLGKDVIQQRNPAPEAGHSQALASSRSSQKRTADDMPPEPLIRSKRRKMSTTRRPKARPPALPVVQHRYPTRSKLNASDHRNNFVAERNTELARIRQTNKPTYGDSKLSQPKYNTRRRR